MIEANSLNTRLELEKTRNVLQKHNNEMVFGIFTIMMQILMQ
jgi:hypothetical protein